MSKSESTPPRASRKFMFDAHNFDEPDHSGPPPPPTFSEEELSASRKESYQLGKKDGNAEAQASIERQIMDTLTSLRDNFKIIFDEEDRRNRVFEKEAVQLACTMFVKAFPALNERHGMDEVEAVIERVLETVREQPEILVEVPAAYVDVIQSHIDTLIGQEGRKCIVRGNETMTVGNCRMAWTNGNAARHAGNLAEQIKAQVEQVLADKAILTDNNPGAGPVAIPATQAMDDGERDE